MTHSSSTDHGGCPLDSGRKITAVVQRGPFSEVQSASTDWARSKGKGDCRTSRTIDCFSRTRYSVPQMSQVPRKYGSSGRPNPPRYFQVNTPIPGLNISNLC